MGLFSFFHHYVIDSDVFLYLGVFRRDGAHLAFLAPLTPPSIGNLDLQSISVFQERFAVVPRDASSAGMTLELTYRHPVVFDKPLMTETLFAMNVCNHVSLAM